MSRRHSVFSGVLAIILVASSVFGQTSPPGFPITLSGAGIDQSSIAIGDVDGDGKADDIVVGGRDGVVSAYRGDGSLIFSFDTGSTGIEGRPAIGDVDGDGLPEVVATVGSNIDVGPGRLVVLSNTGALQCDFVPLDSEPNGVPDGIYTSPALADLDRNDGGKLEIIFGAWDQRIRAFNHDCTPLWQNFVLDTVYSSPAIGDIDGDGDLDVVSGADSHMTPQTTDGGLIVAFDGPTGATLPGFPIQLDEIVISSPALADLDRDGRLDIIVGTGNCWGSGNLACGNPQHPGVGEYIVALDHTGTALPGWPVAITGQIADGSPAVADIDNDGFLEVVINGFVRGSGPPATGKLWVIEHTGAIRSGYPKSPSTPAGCNGATVSWGTPASPILADVDNDGDIDIVLPSNAELVAWDARSGTQLTRTALGNTVCTPVPVGSLVFATAWSVAGSAAIGDIDNDGFLELVVGGYATFPNVTPGAIYAWNLATPSTGKTPWPMFKRNALGLSVWRDPLFADGFASGSTSAWSATVP